MAGKVVCVTGASGFLGSWLVKILLSKNYTVHGTVRDPLDEKKCAHLKNLENASENLKLFKADLLDYESLRAAIVGCDGVFHTASPVPSGSITNPQVELVEPSVNGTLNVLKACHEANVKRVVYVSSVVALVMMPNRPDGPLDETWWSDQEFCRKNNDWYCLSKTQAESEAWEFSKRNGIDLVSMCPTLILGPMLQNAANASSLVIIKLLRDGKEEVENGLRQIVDVRDLAEALILVYEKPEANGRYVCLSHEFRTKDMVDILKKKFPNYKYPNKYTEPRFAISATSEKLKGLGWSYRSLEETLSDAVENYVENGLLTKT